MSFSVLKTRSRTSPDASECADPLKGHLKDLGLVIGDTWGLATKLVILHRTPYLCVFTKKPALRHADIGVTFEDDLEWWFEWAKDGRTIGPVSELDDAADAVVAWLCRPLTLADSQN